MNGKRARFYIGLCLVGLVIGVALIGLFMNASRHQAIDLAQRFAGPSWQHPFGLDQDGGDVFAKVVSGARISLMVSFSVVGISLLIGLIVGSLAGYCGGWVDLLFMRLVDMIYSFPGFLLALALVAVMGPSIFNVIIAMCITGWTGYARVVRAEVLHLREREYVQSAVALGAHPIRQVVLHIWPNLAPILVVNATFGLAGAILTESGLSFLGLGAPATTPTWGQLLDSGRKYLLEAPHVSIFPGLTLMTLVLGFNLLGDGLRDLLDSKD